MSSIKIHTFQHVAFEGPAYIATWAQQRGHSLTYSKFYNNDPIPQLADIDWLLVMGGPMNINDEAAHPWLKQEKAFIKQAIDAGKTVIGICLGAQLIASVLGAAVKPNKEKEIGWFPLRKTSEGKNIELLQALPEEMTVFHWHGDTFEIPKGTQRIFESKACKNQGFYADRILGLQFHFEVNKTALNHMIENCKHELSPDTYVQDEVALKEGEKYSLALNKYLASMLDKLAVAPDI